MLWELQIPLFAELVLCGCLLGVGELVDQCSSREIFVRKEEEESGEGKRKSFRRGGKGRDGCSPEV